MGMKEYIIRRALLAIPTFFGIMTLVFFVSNILPGDPALTLVGEFATAEQIAAIREELGLNAPVHIRYKDFLLNMIRLDFGRSYVLHRPAFGEVLLVLPYTIEMAVMAIVISVVGGIPLGILAALRRGKAIDQTVLLSSTAGICLPGFLKCMLLILIFSLWLKWFPATGAGSHDDPIDLLRHLILPSLSGGLYFGSITAQLTRSSLLEVMDRGYILTARSKGLSEQIVITRHALKNALIPLVTVIGLNLGVMLGGSAIVEILFARPGLGWLLLTAITSRDYNVMQACIFVFAVIFVVLNLLVDILYCYIDPRIRVT